MTQMPRDILYACKPRNPLTILKYFLSQVKNRRVKKRMVNKHLVNNQ